MDRYQRVTQAALELRDELPELLGPDYLEADRGLALLIEQAIREPGGESTTAIIKFLERWPEAKHRFNELLTGAWRSAAAAEAGATLPPDGYALVEVLYATDRKATGSDQPDASFSNEKSIGEDLSWGKCKVSIPSQHQRGALESPGLLRWVIKADPRKHVLVLSIEPFTAAQFAASVGAQLDGSGAPQALVFIHGYNVRFHDAVRRTAQLQEDLAFSGPAICFSWPSRGEFLGYGADGDSAQWAAPHLAALVRRLREIDGGIRIHLVAHSMGNRVMTMALQTMVLKDEHPESSVRQIVLAAPDIDRNVFEQLAGAIRGAGQRVTLYASSNDRALWVSKLLHRGPRAGDCGPDMVLCEGIDTIDASLVDSSLLSLRHGYFSAKPSVLTDLTRLIRSDEPPADRGLQQALGGRYWVMQP
jgi:esterase/lipase superfamily enzyme